MGGQQGDEMEVEQVETGEGSKVDGDDSIGLQKGILWRFVGKENI